MLDAWLTDTFDIASGSLSFSRSDRRVGDTNLSGIDTWYMDEWACSRGGTAGILDGTTLTDHASVVLHLDDAGQSRQSQSPQIPTRLIEDEQKERYELYPIGGSTGLQELATFSRHRPRVMLGTPTNSAWRSQSPPQSIDHKSLGGPTAHRKSPMI